MMHTQIEDNAGERARTWQKVWETKYKSGRGPVHKRDGFDLLTTQQWKQLVASFHQMMEPLAGTDILEVGCGAGAFLGNIKGARSLAGIDYSESAIQLVKSTLKGEYICSEADYIPFPTSSFDVVFSFGVFFYFDSLVYAESVVQEMLRVVRPGGRVYILELNDAAKTERYHQVRSMEDRRDAVKTLDGPTTHLFFEKRWFQNLSHSSSAVITIRDETELDISFHSGSEYRFVVRFDVPR